MSRALLERASCHCRCLCRITLVIARLVALVELRKTPHVPPRLLDSSLQLAHHNERVRQPEHAGFTARWTSKQTPTKNDAAQSTLQSSWQAAQGGSPSSTTPIILVGPSSVQRTKSEPRRDRPCIHPRHCQPRGNAYSPSRRSSPPSRTSTLALQLTTCLPSPRTTP